jgi:hypothetical protein
MRAFSRLTSVITPRINTGEAVYNAKLPDAKDTVVNLICMERFFLDWKFALCLLKFILLFPNADLLAHKNFAQSSACPFKPDKYTCRFFEFDLLLYQVIPKDDDDEEEEEEIPDFTINLLKFNTNILKV